MSLTYHRPQTLRDALGILSAHDVIVLAGGTDVYPNKATRAGWGQTRHADVLDISLIPEMHGITEHADHWRIGAATTWSELIAAPLPPCFDGLKTAAREIGGVQIQNRGTIGGNIVTASPAGDGIPCLLALDAEIECVGGVEFRVPLAQFITGYRQTALAGELVTAIRIAKQPGRGTFLKLGARRYLVISIAMVSGVIDQDEDGRVRRAAIAVGACSAIAQRLHRLEAALIGHRPSRAMICNEHLDGLQPIDDVRASAPYRRAAARELVGDLLDQFSGVAP
jgi:N-methylhydantoinase B